MHDPTNPPAPPQQSSAQQADALSEAIYASFERMLTPQQIADLYVMCLDDADRRIRLLQLTADQGDEEAFRRATHSIKGTCGMVGAVQLAALAAAMEKAPMPQPGDLAPYAEFLLASAELRRILNAKSIPLFLSSVPDTL